MKMKKFFKRFAAVATLAAMLTSCSLLKGAASGASSTGSSTGSALSALYTVLKSTGGLDLSNITNLLNLGKILTGAKSLADASGSFTEQFTSGLIEGSSNLVNSANAGSVIQGLKSLAGIDTSALTEAASQASKGLVPQVSQKTEGVAETLGALQSIFNLMK